ncbi:hypothetical protein WJX72_002683 [[Myrmecia] bisecta]|uniref:tRNA (guanine(9)-N(1))-methyltransferase n=1 Tax=[Myrmecia] bisecta TaxID=41462 RepID=A0AAW1Q0R1_9CHLO
MSDPGPIPDANGSTEHHPVEQLSCGGAAEADAQESNPPLSKNAKKKLLKQQRYAEKKAARKASNKEARKAEVARKKMDSQANLESMSASEREAWRVQRLEKLKARRETASANKALKQQAMATGQPIVLDLAFGEHMTDAEIKSLCQQIAYCYAANSRASRPFHLHLASLQGKMLDAMQQQLSGFQNWPVSRDSRTFSEIFSERKADLVYLTADSPTELAHIDSKKIYIIGGLVDRNRFKNLTIKRADQEGISTARLPISAHMKLASSPVLTVNHVFEILLHFASCHDWEQSFMKIIPSRKIILSAQAASEPPAPHGRAGDAMQSSERGEDRPAAKRARPGQEAVSDGAVCSAPP